MDKIYYTRVQLYDSKYFRENDKIQKAEFNVIGENTCYLVIDNFGFTTLQKEEERYASYPCINVPNISVPIKDPFYGSGFIYTCYSTTPPNMKRIKKQIEQKIKEKVGFFVNGINLDFITEGE